MGLHVIIGFSGPGNSAKAFPVYVGGNATEAEAAMRTSTAVRFQRFSNAIGIAKNNPHRSQPGVHVDDENIWDKALDKRRGAIKAAEEKKAKADVEAKEAASHAKASTAGSDSTK